MTNIMPPGPLAYEGQVVVPFIIRNGPPTTSNFQFSVPTVWVDKLNKNAYILVSVALKVADWVFIGGTPGNLETLTGNSGGVIMPSAGNINLVGDGTTITGVGNPGTSTITFSATGSLATTYTTDSGTASPSANNLIVTGGTTGLTTLGSGNTISLTGTLAVSHGGTGATTFNTHGVLVGEGTSAATSTSAGTTGQVLTATTSADPAFQNIGANSGLTAHGVVISEGNGAFTASSAVSTNALLMGTTGSDPNWTTSGTPYVSGISFDSGTDVLQNYVNTTTFTPVIAGSTSAGTATYNTQSGRYTRLGNWVFYNINLVWSGHTGTGNMLVTGFPLTFGAAQNVYPAVCLAQNITFPASTNWVVANGTNNTTQAQLLASISGAAFANVVMSATGSLHISGFYPVA